MNAQEARIIIVGRLAGGALFTARLSRARDLSLYTASVDQVASAFDDRLRDSLKAYTLSLTSAQ